MGIPRFWKDVVSRIPGVVLHQIPLRVSSLSIDMGGLIHKARFEVYDLESSNPREREAFFKALAQESPAVLEGRFHAAVERLILEAMDLSNPADTLILAFDGVAPAAKMNQQRSRRQRNAKLPKLTPVDSNALSPGTEFMQRLDNNMVSFILKNRLKLPGTVIYSSHMVPGEGEHKIMEYYRDGTVSKAARYGLNHVIWGLDADLILLSTISPLEHLFIAREDASEVIDVDTFKSYLRKNVTGPRDPLADFTVIMSLLGNDFLPHSPLVGRLSQTVELLLDVYRKGSYTLTNYGSVDWIQFRAYLGAVLKRQGELITEAVREQEPLPDLHKNKILLSSFTSSGFSMDLFKNAWYQHVLGPKNSALARTISDLTKIHLEPTAQDVREMCLDYCRTIDWVYRYYSQGASGISHSWGYPHYHTPVLNDVYTALDQVTVLRGAGPGPIPEPEFTVIHQLLAILPPSSAQLLPEPYRKLMVLGSDIIDMYPSEYVNEMIGTDKEHLSVVMVPIETGYAARQRIRDAVASIVVQPEMAEAWLSQTDHVFTRSADEEKMYYRQLKEIREARRERFLELREASAARGAERDRGGFVGGFRESRGSRGGQRGGYGRENGKRRDERQSNYGTRDRESRGGRGTREPRGDRAQRATDDKRPGDDYRRRRDEEDKRPGLQTPAPFGQKLSSTGTNLHARSSATALGGLKAAKKTGSSIGPKKTGLVLGSGVTGVPVTGTLVSPVANPLTLTSPKPLTQTPTPLVFSTLQPKGLSLGLKTLSSRTAAPAPQPLTDEEIVNI